jgi:hypothetical protein
MLCLGLACLVALICSSESFQQCEHDRKNHKHYATLHEESALFIKPIVRLELHAACARVTAGENDGAIIAVFTIVLALFTVRLAIATDKLVAGADDTAKRQLRAYILVDEANIGNFGPGAKPQVKITLRNFGQTPAYDVRQWSSLGVDHYPPRLDVPKCEWGKEMAKCPIGPNGILFSIPPNNRPLLPDDFTAIKGGGKAIYVIGGVRYSDAFGKDQATDFSLFFGGIAGTHGLSPTATGNGAT